MINYGTLGIESDDAIQSFEGSIPLNMKSFPQPSNKSDGLYESVLVCHPWFVLYTFYICKKSVKQTEDSQ